MQYNITPNDPEPSTFQDIINLETLTFAKTILDISFNQKDWKTGQTVSREAV